MLNYQRVNHEPTTTCCLEETHVLLPTLGFKVSPQDSLARWEGSALTATVAFFCWAVGNDRASPRQLNTRRIWNLKSGEPWVNKWGSSKRDGLGEIHLSMDENWGYPYDSGNHQILKSLASTSNPQVVAFCRGLHYRIDMSSFSRWLKANANGPAQRRGEILCRHWDVLRILAECLEFGFL